MIYLLIKNLYFILIMNQKENDIIIFKRATSNMITKTDYFNSAFDPWYLLGSNLLQKYFSSKIISQYLSKIKNFQMIINNFINILTINKSSIESIFQRNIQKNFYDYNECINDIVKFFDKFNINDDNIYIIEIKKLLDLNEFDKKKDFILKRDDNGNFPIKEEWNDRVKHFNKMFNFLVKFENSMKTLGLKDKKKMLEIENINDNKLLKPLLLEYDLTENSFDDKEEDDDIGLTSVIVSKNNQNYGTNNNDFTEDESTKIELYKDKKTACEKFNEACRGACEDFNKACKKGKKKGCIIS